MKVQVEAKPLHEPLAGGTPGATVAVEPIVAGHVNFPQAMMEQPGRPLRDAEAAARAAHRQAGRDVSRSPPS